MAIPVTCPSCLTRFDVSDKFAGKSGPCPKCQKTIKIPDKSEQVVIHAPEATGPKDSKGRSVLKPLRRKEVSLGLPVILAAALSTLVVFGIALGVGLSGSPPTALLVMGSILLALPLCFVGYWFLHDDELEGFTGKQLLVRVGVGSLVFAATWGIYALVPIYLFEHASTAEISGLQMAVFIAVMIALGTVASILIFELEVMQGMLHYMFYFAITFLLAWLAGTPLAEPLSNGANSAARPPAARPPAVTTPDIKAPPSEAAAPAVPPPTAPATEEQDRKIPKMLQ